MLEKLFLISSSIFLISLLSCQQSEDLDKHLSNLKELNSSIDLDGWKIGSVAGINKLTYFALYKHEEDTQLNLNFTFEKYGSQMRYGIEDFVISYLEGRSYHIISLSNKDTLYYYTCPDLIGDSNSHLPSNFISFKFIIGKYYYMNRNFKLNCGQMRYYDEHTDSLSKIRGNDLPVLPEIESFEEDVEIIDLMD